MTTPKRQEQRPGTVTRDPAEGKRTDVRQTPQTAYPAANPEQPGTKMMEPAEGGDDTSGAEKTEPPTE